MLFHEIKKNYSFEDKNQDINFIIQTEQMPFKKRIIKREFKNSLGVLL